MTNYVTRICLAALLLSIAFSAQADSDIEALSVMKAVRQNYSKMTSLKMQFSVQLSYLVFKTGKSGTKSLLCTALLERPNLAHLDFTGDQTKEVIADGKSVFDFRAKLDSCIKRVQIPDFSCVYNVDSMAVYPFLQPGSIPGTAVDDVESALAKDANLTLRYLGQEDVEGVQCHVIEAKRQDAKIIVDNKEFTSTIVERFWIDNNSCIKKQSWENNNGRGVESSTFVINQLDDKPVIDRSVFMYTPKQTTTIFDENQSTHKDDFAGNHCQEFILSLPDGRTVTLGNLLKGKKALLLNFWFYNCAYCRAEFPQMQSIYNKYKNMGLEFLAVDIVDDPDRLPLITAYFDKNAFTFPIAFGKHSQILEKYNITGGPITLLIDRTGTIVWSLNGYHPKILSKEIDAKIKELCLS